MTLEAANTTSTTLGGSRGAPWAYWLAAGLFVAALAAFTVDLPIARACREVETTGRIEGVKIRGEVKKLLSLSEVFGHGFGVALVCLSWFALDKSRRWSLARVIASSYGSGFLADCCKLFIGRTRPNAYDFDRGAETFIGFFPALQTWDVAQLTNRAIQSFPSGHSATAAGLAVVLGAFYPHARWLFALLAALALLQRVEAGAHFLSDTLAGAALGCLVAGVCLDPRLFGRVFDWIERRRPTAP